MIPRFDRTPVKTRHARRLRHDATPSERRLWSRLQSAQIDGVSFRRQHPIGPYVLDFYAPSLSLAIEVDGGQHGTNAVAKADMRRKAWLQDRGITILRFWNSEIADNLEGVVEVIRLAILERCESVAVPATQPPPPFRGRKRVGHCLPAHTGVVQAASAIWWDASPPPPLEKVRRRGDQSGVSWIQ